MDFRQVLLTRASCRSYSDKSVSDQEIDSVLAGAHAAPVGMAAYQTVHLTVIRDKEILQAISHAASEFFHRDGDPLYGAPVLILVSAKPGMPPAIEYHNTGAIIENMLLTATDLGMGSVYLMGAIAALNANPDLIARLDLPEGFVPTAGMALGHPVQPLELRIPTKKIEVNFV